MRQHFERIRLVARLHALLDAELVHRTGHIRHRPTLADQTHDQLAMRHQVVLQLFEDGVFAETRGIADIGDHPVAHGRHVEDDRHVLLQPPRRRKEREVEAGHVRQARKALERGAVAKPRERLVQPVMDAAIAKPLGEQLGRVLLGHAGAQHAADGFDARVSELLDFAKLGEFVDKDARQGGVRHAGLLESGYRGRSMAPRPMFHYSMSKSMRDFSGV